MARPTSLDLMHALLGATPDAPCDGQQVTERLAQAGFAVRADAVLSGLLGLERSGHVTIGRTGAYTFALTPLGEDTAYALGPGMPVDLTVVMVDLVGFVAFTDAAGDVAAHQAATQLAVVGTEELKRSGGAVVKRLGDAILGHIPAGEDPVAPVRAIATRCTRPDGTPWQVRAAAREGQPIRHAGDLFGTDVNLVARLCEEAAPDEIVISRRRPDAAPETLAVRGFTAAVPVERVAVR